MRLPQFIVANSELILAEFEEFARTHTNPGETMDIEARRDHAGGMLRTIAVDIEEPQTEGEQSRKSKGEAPEEQEAGRTAAERHGADRAGSGFTLDEMFSEYRALRASVLRLWTQSQGRMDEVDLQDLIRFNEAIDQALAESITEYSTGIEHSREMFLAILGHDLRSPLAAVLTASSFLVTEGNLANDNLTLASRIQTSGKRMLALVSDLLDFTRSRLGSGIPIIRADTDIAALSSETLDEIKANHPHRDFRFSASGDLRGQWDRGRVSQALSNLIGNAVQHGNANSPIVVSAREEGDKVVISVQNRGAVISDADQADIFNPFKSLTSAERPEQDQKSMGLGLYITQQIAIAHDGSIDVESSEELGTTFQLHLPRAA